MTSIMALIRFHKSTIEQRPIRGVPAQTQVNINQIADALAAIREQFKHPKTFQDIQLSKLRQFTSQLNDIETTIVELINPQITQLRIITFPSPRHRSPNLESMLHEVQSTKSAVVETIAIEARSFEEECAVIDQHDHDMLVEDFLTHHSCLQMAMGDDKKTYFGKKIIQFCKKLKLKNLAQLNNYLIDRKIVLKFLFKVVQEIHNILSLHPSDIILNKNDFSYILTKIRVKTKSVSDHADTIRDVAEIILNHWLQACQSSNSIQVADLINVLEKEGHTYKQNAITLYEHLYSPHILTELLLLLFKVHHKKTKPLCNNFLHFFNAHSLNKKNDYVSNLLKLLGLQYSSNLIPYFIETLKSEGNISLNDFAKLLVDKASIRLAQINQFRSRSIFLDLNFETIKKIFNQLESDAYIVTQDPNNRFEFIKFEMCNQHFSIKPFDINSNRFWPISPMLDVSLHLDILKKIISFSDMPLCIAKLVLERYPLETLSKNCYPLRDTICYVLKSYFGYQDSLIAACFSFFIDILSLTQIKHVIQFVNEYGMCREENGILTSNTFLDAIESRVKQFGRHYILSTLAHKVPNWEGIRPPLASELISQIHQFPFILPIDIDNIDTCLGTFENSIMEIWYYKPVGTWAILSHNQHKVRNEFILVKKDNQEELVSTHFTVSNLGLQFNLSSQYAFYSIKDLIEFLQLDYSLADSNIETSYRQSLINPLHDIYQNLIAKDSEFEDYLEEQANLNYLSSSPFYECIFDQQTYSDRGFQKLLTNLRQLYTNRRTAKVCLYGEDLDKFSIVGWKRQQERFFEIQQNISFSYNHKHLKKLMNEISTEIIQWNEALEYARKDFGPMAVVHSSEFEFEDYQQLPLEEFRESCINVIKKAINRTQIQIYEVNKWIHIWCYSLIDFPDQITEMITQLKKLIKERSKDSFLLMCYNKRLFHVLTEVYRRIEIILSLSYLNNDEYKRVEKQINRGSVIKCPKLNTKVIRLLKRYLATGKSVRKLQKQLIDYISVKNHIQVKTDKIKQDDPIKLVTKIGQLGFQETHLLEEPFNFNEEKGFKGFVDMGLTYTEVKHIKTFHEFKEYFIAYKAQSVKNSISQY